MSFWLSLAIFRYLGVNAKENITGILLLFSLLNKYVFFVFSPNTYHPSLWKYLKVEALENSYSPWKWAQFQHISYTQSIVICSMHSCRMNYLSKDSTQLYLLENFTQYQFWLYKVTWGLLSWQKWPFNKFWTSEEETESQECEKEEETI